MATGAGKTDHKIVVVLNKKKRDSGVILNAAAHMAAALVAKSTEEQLKNMMFVDYVDADGGIHPVSALSLVILKADNSNKVRAARNEAIRLGVPFVDFTETMTQDTYVEQMERTKQIKESDLEYWGLALFGDKDLLNEITGKFSLWQ